MITFKKFINEEEHSSIFNANIIADIIKRDCSKWLKEVKNPSKSLIYRGSKSVSLGKNLLTKKSVRTDRSPKDTPKKMHDYIDNWFNKKFGIKFRSQALFVSGDKDIANQFGKVWIVFPINDYDYLWSPFFKDMTEDIDDAIMTRVKKLFNSYELSKEDFEYIQKYGSYASISIYRGNEILDYVLDKAEYKMNLNLTAAIKQGLEIMIYTDEYYMLGPLNEQNNNDKIYEILDLL